MSDRMIQDSPTVLSLRLHQRNLPRFFPLFQQGFLVKAPGGGSIRTILCGYWGLDPKYLEGRIQTIFLNGKPVDEVDAAMVGAGDTLALSAAMPGLVGATMRKGGFFASLRANISHRGKGQATSEGECLVRLKLFNLLIRELGPFFLEKGIWLKRAVLEEILHQMPEDFWEGCWAASLNGEELDLQALRAMAWPTGENLVCLKVIVSPG